MTIEEKANPVLEEEKETPTETPTEKETNETEEGSQPVEKTVDNNVPYHKDPRWIEMYDKAKRVDELEEKFQSQEEKIAELAKAKQEPERPEEAPSWFMGTEEDWQKYLAREEQKATSIRESVKAELEQEKVAKAQEKEEEISSLTSYFDNELLLLKEDFQFDEKELKDYVIEHNIVDSEGVFDLKRGLMKMLGLGKTATNPARKEVASMTSSNKDAEPSKRDFATAEDFQGGGRPW